MKSPQARAKINLETARFLAEMGDPKRARVILQGVLGGLRVVLLQHTLAIIHACLAQAFFALASMLVAIPTGIQMFAWIATLVK